MKLLCIVVLVFFPSFALASLDLDEGIYRNRTLGIKLTLPENWLPSTHTGYPDLLLLIIDSPRKASISLAFGDNLQTTNVQSFVEDNTEALKTLGLKITQLRSKTISNQKAWEVRAVTGDNLKEIHQVFLPHQQMVLIFTLTCPVKEFSSCLSELTLLISTIELLQPRQEKHIQQSSSPSKKRYSTDEETLPNTSPDMGTSTPAPNTGTNATPPNTSPPNTSPPNTSPPNTSPPNTSPPNTSPPNTRPEAIP